MFVLPWLGGWVGDVETLRKRSPAHTWLTVSSVLLGQVQHSLPHITHTAHDSRPSGSATHEPVSEVSWMQLAADRDQAHGPGGSGQAAVQGMRTWAAQMTRDIQGSAPSRPPHTP